MLSRDEALNLLRRYLKDDRMVKHCIAVEAIMKTLARRLGEDEELWSLAGLLHDIDHDYVGRDMSRHGLEALKILKGLLPQYLLEAIATHNEYNDFKTFFTGSREDAPHIEGFRPFGRPHSRYSSCNA